MRMPDRGKWIDALDPLTGENRKSKVIVRELSTNLSKSSAFCGDGTLDKRLANFT